ncbi:MULTISPECIES: substrate-binding domain-containing protein [unclassified Paenibacillus]|uniref:substrate-binding domain-containing protein n=1 Tax=unclassified Paenibacillus TaxID=185978 RepID=UPI003628945C
MRRLAGLAFAVVIIAASILTYQTSSGGYSEKNKPILFVPKAVGQKTEFWQVMNQGVFAAAKEYGAEVKVVGTSTEDDIDGQIRLLEQAIVDKPKAIILAATDYNRIVPVAQKIVNAGIKLITVDSDLMGDLSASFIATDNYAAGQKVGQALKRRIEPGATIAVINFVKGSAPAMERERGVRDSLKDSDDLQVLDTYYSDASEEKAYAVTKKLLLTHPRIGGIVGLNEPSTVGAAKAIKEAGMQIPLIGFDNSMDEISFLEEGILHATVIQKPFNMGYLAIKTAVQVINGERVSTRIDTGSEVITKKDMYTHENQKLLFPFVDK